MTSKVKLVRAIVARDLPAVLAAGQAKREQQKEARRKKKGVRG